MGKHEVTPRPAWHLPYQISVCGKAELEIFRDRNVTHLLSIESPVTSQPTPPWFRGTHWLVYFDDVESIQEEVLFHAVAPREREVAAILEWGQECLAASRLKPVHLLVHCFAGISRSTAAAFALAVQALGKGHAEDALGYVVGVRPEAYPNLRVVQLADTLLQQEGAMLRALAPMRPAVGTQYDMETPL